MKKELILTKAKGFNLKTVQSQLKKGGYPFKTKIIGNKLYRIK